MKKIIAFVFVSFSLFAYCQDVKVNINNQDATAKDDCVYRINGICSTEDIGGVNVDVIFAEENTWAEFTNYNSFPVTVLYEIANSGDGKYYPDNFGSLIFKVADGHTGSLVLGENGNKKVKLDHSSIKNYTHSIFDNSHCYSIRGLIVRKLSK